MNTITPPPVSFPMDLDAFGIQTLLMWCASNLGVFKNMFITPMETIDPRDLPAIAVFLISENMESLGNAGPPQFLHTAHYGLQAIILSSDAEDQRIKLHNLLGQLDRAILTNAKALMPIEEIKSIERRFRYERVAEAPVAQFNSAFRLTFRSIWEPDIRDDFNTLTVTTAFPVGGDTGSVEQIRAAWEMQSGTGAIPSPPLKAPF